jgi:hypothetical protein
MDILVSSSFLPAELKKQACKLGNDLSFDKAQGGFVLAHFLEKTKF